MSGRCYTITLPDGSQAIVRTGKAGWKPSAADLDAITELRKALRERKHCRYCGGGMAGGEEGLLKHEENCLARPGA
jgi:hypothetical protein